MRPCNSIYYSKVYWMLDMFLTAYRSSSGALNYLLPLVYIHMWWPAVVKSEFPLRLDNGRSSHLYVNQRLQYSLDLLMMSGMPLEKCWAFNERWNNKFYYNVASFWLFLLIHTAMHGSMNIKCNIIICVAFIIVKNNEVKGYYERNSPFFCVYCFCTC
jgi:hypothetical protein